MSCPGKVFAHIVLSRVKDMLFEARRKEQSGFKPGSSTIDQISALNSIIQGRREYQQPLGIAYVDLKAAFDSVDRPSFWLLLRSLGVPSKIVNLMIYTETTSCVHTDGELSGWFDTKSGVGQRWNIAPALFLAPMD